MEGLRCVTVSFFADAAVPLHDACNYCGPELDGGRGIEFLCFLFLTPEFSGNSKT